MTNSGLHEVILLSFLDRQTNRVTCCWTWAKGALPRQNVVLVAQALSVEKAHLREQIGTLSHEWVEQILAGMRFLQATYFGG